MLIDTHCHLTFPQFHDRGIDTVLRAARENGVEEVICIGCTLEDAESSIELAHLHNHIFVAVGIHPNDCENLPDDYLQRLRKFLCEEKVVALGEVGLDYYREHDKDLQKRCVREQLQLAAERNIPVILHVREAVDDMIKILQDFPDICGVAHSFTGAMSDAERFLELGWYLGCSGIITFKNAASVKDVFKNIPQNRIVLETDAPYLAPVPHRGKTNEPAFTKYIADYLAEIRGVSLNDIAEQTTKNARTVFRLP